MLYLCKLNAIKTGEKPCVYAALNNFCTIITHFSHYVKWVKKINGFSKRLVVTRVWSFLKVAATCLRCFERLCYQQQPDTVVTAKILYSAHRNSPLFRRFLNGYILHNSLSVFHDRFENNTLVRTFVCF